MDVSVPDVRECFRLYGQYKICPDSTCIHANDTCPCLVSDDFQCMDEYCIRRFYWCDGIPDCSQAEDEIDCPNSSTEAMQTGSGSGISMAAVVTISTLCVLFCLAVAAMFVIFVARRTGRLKSGESKSATEPLRKCYISESSDSRDDSDRLPVRAKTYYRKCDFTEEIERDSSIYKPVPKRNGFFTTQNGNHPAPIVSRNNSDDKDIQKANLAIGENAEIYDLDRNEISPKINGLGKYTFKPRLKYTNCNEILFTDKAEKDRLYVINSYKHCSGKSINPGNLTFDTDPEKFSCKFASDVLCSSTPRQGARHMSLPNMKNISMDSIIDVKV